MVFPYTKMINGMWRSTHFIFNLIKNPTPRFFFFSNYFYYFFLNFNIIFLLSTKKKYYEVFVMVVLHLSDSVEIHSIRSFLVNFWYLQSTIWVLKAFSNLYICYFVHFSFSKLFLSIARYTLVAISCIFAWPPLV